MDKSKLPIGVNLIKALNTPEIGTYDWSYSLKMDDSNKNWALAKKLVDRTEKAFCLEGSLSRSATAIFSSLGYDCSYETMHKVLDLAEDLSEDAIEHHKNEIARLQSTLKKIRSFRTENIYR